MPEKSNPLQSKYTAKQVQLRSSQRIEGAGGRVISRNLSLFIESEAGITSLENPHNNGGLFGGKSVQQTRSQVPMYDNTPPQRVPLGPVGGVTEVASFS